MARNRKSLPSVSYGEEISKLRAVNNDLSNKVGQMRRMMDDLKAKRETNIDESAMEKHNRLLEIILKQNKRNLIRLMPLIQQSVFLRLLS